MTRRGSLAFYLAAWVCGSVFMSLAIWSRDQFGLSMDLITIRGAAGLIFFCFYGLFFGLVACLAGASALRRLMRMLKTWNRWKWMVAGSLVAPVVVTSLGAASKLGRAPQGHLTGLAGFVSYGPSVVLDAGWWLAIPAGALTALVLHAIDRAFLRSQIQEDK